MSTKSAESVGLLVAFIVIAFTGALMVFGTEIAQWFARHVAAIVSM